MEEPIVFMNIKTNIFPYKNLHLLWHISCQIQLKDFFVEGLKYIGGSAATYGIRSGCWVFHKGRRLKIGNV